MSAIGLGAVLNERRAPAATVRRARIPIIFRRQSVRECADEGDLRDAGAESVFTYELRFFPGRQINK